MTCFPKAHNAHVCVCVSVQKRVYIFFSSETCPKHLGGFRSRESFSYESLLLLSYRARFSFSLQFQSRICHSNSQNSHSMRTFSQIDQKEVRRKFDVAFARGVHGQARVRACIFATTVSLSPICRFFSRESSQRFLDVAMVSALGSPTLETFVRNTHSVLSQRRPYAGASPCAMCKKGAQPLVSSTKSARTKPSRRETCARACFPALF